jgi:protein-S-isoprenylcysteine O-methyltransferase Ste14
MKSDKGHLRKSHQHRSDLMGEYAFGDMGQLILLVVFLVVWIADSFVFKYSTFLTQHVSNYIRVPIALIVLVISGLLAWAGLKAVFGETREEPQVITTGVFSIVRHPIFWFNITLSWIHFIIAISPFNFSVVHNYNILLYDLTV